MKNIADIIVLIVYLAIVFTMVRPRSQGPTLVKNSGDALAGLIKAATGGGTF